ncbi:MAG: hypothetical protein FD137_1087 [Spirochaetes bacterium]|nr:MAG: hypothetical protein FD137_1087 [Spirochaetota bacterium]
MCRRARCGTASLGTIIGIAAVILVSLSAAGCDWLFGAEPEAYVAGYYGSGSSDSVACYWEGSTRQDLPSNGFAAEAWGISFIGDTVLVAGTYKNALAQHVASMWKDGVRTDLPAPVTSDDTRAVGAFGYGSDAYIAGFYYNNSLGRFVACYWKNGIATSLAAPGMDFAKADAIAVDGSTVRVVGFHAATNEKACIWTDGTRANLPVPVTATKSRAYAIHVSGGHVYVAGYHSDGSVKTACVWSDGVRTDLSSGTDGSAGGVFHADGTTYVAGYLKDASVAVASLWSGASHAFLSAISGKLSGTSGVAVFEDSVYVSGFYGNASDIAVPCYWLDGVRADLPTAGGLAGFATAVAAR